MKISHRSRRQFEEVFCAMSLMSRVCVYSYFGYDDVVSSAAVIDIKSTLESWQALYPDSGLELVQYIDTHPTMTDASRPESNTYHARSEEGRGSTRQTCQGANREIPTSADSISRGLQLSSQAHQSSSNILLMFSCHTTALFADFRSHSDHGSGDLCHVRTPRV